METTKLRATVSVDGDEVVVSGPGITERRAERLFFASLLGGRSDEGVWRCPRRRLGVAQLVVRVNTFLERNGWAVDRIGQADAAVEAEVQRRRSFERTRESASRLRAGTAPESEVLSAVSRLAELGWNDDQRPLRDHQRVGLMHALTAINVANFSVPGAGKTATTLAVAATHLAMGTVDVVVVVGPLSCFRPWETEVMAALGRRLRVRRIRGSRAQRRTAIADTSDGDLLLLSYATAAADKTALVDLCRSHRVMLVVDESHRIKRFRGGLWAPALIEIANLARVRIVLSGTPMPQSGRDLWAQLNVLWPGQELTGPRDGFAARVDGDFPGLLRDIQPFLSRTPKDALGLRPYDIVEHRAEMDGTQAEIYELIETNFRRRVADAHTYKERIDSLRRGRPIRLLQAATNPDLLNGPDVNYNLPTLASQNASIFERLHLYGSGDPPAKSVVALRLLGEIVTQGQKAVVWSNFIRNLDQFANLARSSLGVPVFQVDGRVRVGDDLRGGSPSVGELVDEPEESTRENVIDRFLTTDGPSVLVANPASCSESISLHMACHNAIYLDRTYDCALYLQSIDRIHRLGLAPDQVVRIHIIKAGLRGRPTVDDLVSASLTRKELTMRTLLEGAELRPFDLGEDRLAAAEGDERDLGDLLRFLLGEAEP